MSSKAETLKVSQSAANANSEVEPCGTQLIENSGQPDSPTTDDVVDDEPADVDAAQPRKRSGCAKTLVGIVLVLALIAGAIWMAISEAQKLPEFYARVLQLDEQAAKTKGKEFERNLIQLQNSARRPSPWKIEFSQDQINGWLKSDLPEKFPDSVPAEIKDPRAVLEAQQIKLAFKYESNSGLSGIIVVTAEVFCTDQPNEIAARVISVQSGFIPLPVNPWIERVAEAIRQAGIPMYWENAGGSQIAVFTIPEHLSPKGDSQQVVVEAIELLPGRLIVAGRTEDSPAGGFDKESDSGLGQSQDEATEPAAETTEKSGF